jgi:tRNA(Ile)-lysidine synthase
MYKKRKYWLACSGGVDSVVLAHILALNKLDFGMIHCNFMLRGTSSNDDAIFVNNLANKLGVPCEVKILKINKSENTQLAARKKRYEWFKEIINKGSYVLLAHHADDQEETFWLQLERGAGVAGLSGMALHHDGFIRPLLNYSKKEILELAKNNNWNWREDQSNTSTKYQRNFFRLEVIPALRELGIKNSLINEIVYDYQSLLKELKELELPSNDVNICDWENYSTLFRHELLRRKKIAIRYESEITKLCKSSKGAKIFADNCTIWNNRKTLLFKSDNNKASQPQIIMKTIPSSKVDFTKKHLFYFDVNKLRGEIKIRPWKAGDYFQPLGMKGKKTISDFLTDKKIDAAEKRNILILEDDKKIIAVCGIMPSELAKIDEKTETILVVQC